jgi:hypothetical protein
LWVTGRTAIIKTNEMELVAPGYSLIIWTVFSFISLGVIVYAIVHLAKNKTVSNLETLLWLIFIILIPLFGAIIYLGNRRTKNTNATV